MRLTLLLQPHPGRAAWLSEPRRRKAEATPATSRSKAALSWE